MKRVAAAVVLAVALLPIGRVTPASAGDGCSTPWGSRDRVHDAVEDGGGQGVSGVVRTGRHACFDRFVIETVYNVRGGPAGAPGYRVRYVNRVHQPVTGDRLHLPAGARLDIRLVACACNPGNDNTIPRRAVDHPIPGVDVSGYRTFQSTVYGGWFPTRPITQFGLGVRARLPFRVLQLDGRVVIDVAHHW